MKIRSAVILALILLASCGGTYTQGFGWGHDGSTYGYNSVMAYEPADGVAFAAFVNGTSDDPAQLGLIFSTLHDVVGTFKSDLGY